MTFTRNGEEAFKLKGEEQYIGKAKLYSMMMRKVVFTNPNSYVVATDCVTPSVTLRAELNLNLEDEETYYVVMNGTLKKPFYMEQLSEEEGLKLLKKAQTNKKYHINEPFTYDK